MKVLPRFLLLVLILNGSFIFPRASAQNVPYISVKDFGAKGDGKTDDTRAIQRAIDYAANAGFSTQALPNTKSEIYFGGTKAVYFPLGIYYISQSLKVGSYVDLRGEKAVLAPFKNFQEKIDAITGIGWQAKIEGLQFIAFKAALVINNNNINVGKIAISDCDFINNLTAISLDVQSSIAIIRENRFINNSKVLDVIAGDKVNLYDNWIELGTLSGNQPAAIINRGTLHFDNNLMVPKNPRKGTIEPAWINNYGSVYVHGARQGGEPGSLTLINNFAEAQITYPVVPNTVIVRDSECWGVYGSVPPNYAPTIVRIFRLPNQIIIDGVRGLQDTRVMDIALSIGSANFQKLIDKVPRDKVQVTVTNVSGARYLHKNNSDIPELLTQFKK